MEQKTHVMLYECFGEKIKQKQIIGAAAIVISRGGANKRPQSKYARREKMRRNVSNSV